MALKRRPLQVPGHHDWVHPWYIPLQDSRGCKISSLRARATAGRVLAGITWIPGFASSTAKTRRGDIPLLSQHPVKVWSHRTISGSQYLSHLPLCLRRGLLLSAKCTWLAVEVGGASRDSHLCLSPPPIRMLDCSSYYLSQPRVGSQSPNSSTRPCISLFSLSHLPHSELSIQFYQWLCLYLPPCLIWMAFDKSEPSSHVLLQACCR